MRWLAWWCAASLVACDGLVSELTSPTDVRDANVTSPDSAVISRIDAGEGALDSGADAAVGSVSDAGLDAGAAVDAGPETTQPALSVAFPPPGCATTETHLLVHGSTRAGLSISSVRVAGVPATSTDSFRSWQAEVSLSVGQNLLTVDFTESGGVQTSAASLDVQRFTDEASVSRGAGGWSGRILGAAWDSLGQRVILADDIDDGVWGVHIASGNRVELANSESTKIGGGVDITQPRSGVVRGNTSYVLDGLNVTAVDLRSGDRRVVAELPATLNDFTLLPNGVEAIGGCLDLKAVLSVNVETGSVRVVSSSMVGAGVAVGNFGPLGLSVSRGLAYLGLRYQDALVAVEIASGTRRIFSEAVGAEPRLVDPEFLVVDERVQKAFVWDSGRLVAVDLTSGRRSLFGAGPFAWATAVRAMTLTPYGLALVDYVPSWEPAPHRPPTVLTVDTLTGARVVLSK